MRLDDEEIWYWYQLMEEYLKQDLPPVKFCENKKINHRKFWNMYYRIIYKSVKYPEFYNKHVPIVRKYMESDLTPDEFCKENNINKSILIDMRTHLNYVDIINRLKEETRVKAMKFIEVGKRQARPVPEKHTDYCASEVIEKQNDIEIIISKGVKVSISPNIESMKIIKIIELLKDL